MFSFSLPLFVCDGSQVLQVGLEFALSLKITLNSWSAHLHLLSALCAQASGCLFDKGS